MFSARITVGGIEVVALADGDAPIGPITEHFADVDAQQLLAWRERAPGIHADGDEWRLLVRAWLVRDREHLVLMDTGLGASVSMAWFPEPGRLHASLAEQGVEAGDVDIVAISHIHDDHIGGTTTAEGTPAFPNARYILQRADLDQAREDADEDEEGRAIWDALLGPLEAGGVLDAIEGDRRLSEALELHLAPGHTPGHQVLRIEAGSEHALLAADAWNHPGQFPHPDWPSGSDREPARAAATRRALVAELFSTPRTVVATAHLADAFGQVVNGEGGLPEWRPIG